jgi:hypothetical protein
MRHHSFRREALTVGARLLDASSQVESSHMVAPRGANARARLAGSLLRPTARTERDRGASERTAGVRAVRGGL